MKVIIVGSTGAIGGAILQQAVRRNDITQIIALTRKLLSDDAIADKKVENIIIRDFGDLENVQDDVWEKLRDADALVWAMGTYNLNEDVNLKYPLAFQESFVKRLHATSQKRTGRNEKFRFILLSGAFVEPDQSRRLFFLWDQRRMKGVLQTKTIDFAKENSDIWEALVIRPGGVLFGGDTFVNKSAEFIFGKGLVIRGEELGAFVAGLAVNGSQHSIIGNLEMVETGRKRRRNQQDTQ